MGFPKKIGSNVIGGNVPIIGRKKIDMADVPRFTGRQLQEFLFDAAFGITEFQAMINLKLNALAEEVGLEFDITEEAFTEEAKRILPQVMASFNFQEEEEDAVDGRN